MTAVDGAILDVSIEDRTASTSVTYPLGHTAAATLAIQACATGVTRALGDLDARRNAAHVVYLRQLQDPPAKTLPIAASNPIAVPQPDPVTEPDAGAEEEAQPTAGATVEIGQEVQEIVEA